MWECQFNIEKMRNQELKAYLQANGCVDAEPLDPRDAFFGGRTNCTKLYYEADTGNEEKIRYLDVCSLYPWACKYGRFPVRHPEIITGDDCPQDLDRIDGVVKVTILPPQNLYHPVLPVRIRGKLFFPLCKICAEESNNMNCTHTPGQRELRGTWVADEIKLAISKGYTLIKVHEVWKYTMQGNDERALFTKYINKFLKLKQEASGWPEWVKSEADKDRYIEEFELKEGIHLDREQIRKNPGFRALAKLMLNSFWGKFGQRNTLSKTTFVKTKEDLTTMMLNPNITINDVLPITNDVLLVNWNEEENAILPSTMTSVVIAAYVTTIARMKLYSYLDTLGERVLYFDTDSVIFSERPGDTTLPTGDFLGDLTDELEEYGKGSFIDMFVSGGPKNYAYRVRVKGTNEYKYVCKVKGISLNHKNSLQVNFHKLREMVVENPQEQVLLQGTRICRTKNMDVLTKPEKKTYRIVYSKRRRIDNFDTLPFGYQS